MTEFSIPYDKMIIPLTDTLWQHFKGKIYEVNSISIREETNEPSINYKSQGIVSCPWNRPIRSWYAWVPDYGPRFIPQSIIGLRSYFKEHPEKSLAEFIEELPKLTEY